jgi:hypothetical protein
MPFLFYLYEENSTSTGTKKASVKTEAFHILNDFN